MGVCTSAPEDLSNSTSSRPRSARGSRQKRSPSHLDSSSVEGTAASSLVSPTGLPDGAPGFNAQPYDANYLHPNYTNNYMPGAARMNRYHSMSAQMYNNNNYNNNNGNGFAQDPLVAAKPYNSSPNAAASTSSSLGVSPMPLTAQPSNRTPVPLNIAVNQHTNNNKDVDGEVELPRVPLPPPRPIVQDVMGDDMSSTAMSLDNYSYFDSRQASPARQLGGREASGANVGGGDGLSMTSEYSMQNYIVEMLYNKDKKKNNGTAAAAGGNAQTPNNTSATSNNGTSTNGVNANKNMMTLPVVPNSRTSRTGSETASQSSTALSVDDNFINFCKKENLNDVNISQLNEELHMKLVANGLARDGPYKYTTNNNNNNRRATVPNTEGTANTEPEGNPSASAPPTSAMRRRTVSFIGEMR